MSPTGDDLRGLSMLELFRVEVDAQVMVVTEGLLQLEIGERDAGLFEALMRAAHSLKGAARLVGIPPAERVAHAMEDVFVAAGKGALDLRPPQIDSLLRAIDAIARIAALDADSMARADELVGEEVKVVVSELQGLLESRAPSPPRAPERDVTGSGSERRTDVRLSPERLDRLLGLAGDVQVASGWYGPFAGWLQRVRRDLAGLGRSLEQLGDEIDALHGDHAMTTRAAEGRRLCEQLTDTIADRLLQFERVNYRLVSGATSLYREVVETRLRPFADGVEGLRRLARDAARSLGKEAGLEVRGTETLVDREVLERLKAALNHLVRNAVDHGIELPHERVAQGKPAAGEVLIEASHVGGMMRVVVRDDGRGVDPEAVRHKVVETGLTSDAVAARMTGDELLDFLFLPGFSTRSEVSDLSGRGVGLDVVRTLVRELGGSMRLHAPPGAGTTFELMLPLTLSVVRALLVQVAGQIYAIPLARIARVVVVPLASLREVEGRQAVVIDGQPVIVAGASRILELGSERPPADPLPIVVLGGKQPMGLAVDGLLGERDLVVQPLDPRLGAVKDADAAAILEDGTPVVMLEAEDLARSIQRSLVPSAGEGLRTAQSVDPTRRKRVLVVDDSITVREIQRKLLEGAGYAVEVASDGMEAWGVVRFGRHDLLITDVDMPRLDGIELLLRVKADPHLAAMPVLVVSYKDREEDRMRGLEAGADYYLTKSSFHGEGLVRAVVDLIGEAKE